MQATVWKNGVAEDLVSESSHSCAHYVFVSGSDVYVAGYGKYTYPVHENGTTTATAAHLWKNGKVEKLTDESQNAGALSVYVSDDGDVYVAGYDGDEARLWKNGALQNIVDDKDAKMFLSVYVKDNDVYIAGYAVFIPEEPELMAYYKATLWKNGKRLNLKVGQNESMAFSVFAK